MVRLNYAFLIYQAARLAARLGQPRISIIEFGVAWRRWIACDGVSRGAGREAVPRQNRYLWVRHRRGNSRCCGPLRFVVRAEARAFTKWISRLVKARLKRAEILLRRCKRHSQRVSQANTIPRRSVPSFHDMDFYSSTVTGLKLFDSDLARFPSALSSAISMTRTGHADELFGRLYGRAPGNPRFQRKPHEGEAKSALLAARCSCGPAMASPGMVAAFIRSCGL